MAKAVCEDGCATAPQFLSSTAAEVQHGRCSLKVALVLAYVRGASDAHNKRPMSVTELLEKTHVVQEKESG